MTEEKGIDFKVVAAKFAESSEMLNQLASKISSISSSSELMSKANSNLTDLSRQFDTAIGEFSKITTSLKEVSSKVENATTTAQIFLSQTDLSAVTRGLDAIHITLNGKVSDLTNEVRVLTENLAKRDADLAACTAELEALKTKVFSIPEKTRRKLGI